MRPKSGSAFAVVGGRDWSEGWETLIPRSRFNEARPPAAFVQFPMLCIWDRQWRRWDSNPRDPASEGRAQTVYKTAALNHFATPPPKAGPKGPAFRVCKGLRGISRPLYYSPLSKSS